MNSSIRSLWTIAHVLRLPLVSRLATDTLGAVALSLRALSASWFFHSSSPSSASSGEQRCNSAAGRRSSKRRPPRPSRECRLERAAKVRSSKWRCTRGSTEKAHAQGFESRGCRRAPLDMGRYGDRHQLRRAHICPLSLVSNAGRMSSATQHMCGNNFARPAKKGEGIARGNPSANVTGRVRNHRGHERAINRPVRHESSARWKFEPKADDGVGMRSCFGVGPERKRR